MPSFTSRLKDAAGQRSLQVALLLWLLLVLLAAVLGRGVASVQTALVFGPIALVAITLEIGLVTWLARKRPMPNLAERAPERSIALRETLWLWAYGIAVMLAGRFLGQHFFGEGIAMHLNGSLVGATRVQSPREVIAWALYNGIFLALLPYVAFRLRGCSNRDLNLHSANLKNDLLVILVVLTISCAIDFMGPSIFDLNHHQQLVGGLLSFVLHIFGPVLPIMIFIYAILLPRYARLASPMLAFLLGAASYPFMHIFESATRYDSFRHGTLSMVTVFLLFFPPGLMKSFLTLRTGNAWVHVWAFHAISPHVTVDTRLIVNDFRIR